MNQTGMEKTKGTLRWMAPELLEGEKLNFPVDVYTFGITSWEIYTLEVPFSDIPERAFYRRVIDKRERPKCPTTMDNALVKLVTQCWAHEIVERPTFKTISSSIWAIVAKQEREMGLKAISTRDGEQKRKTELETRAVLERQERKEEKDRREQEKLDQLRQEKQRVRKESKVNDVLPPRPEQPVSGPKVAEPRKQPTKAPAIINPSPRPERPVNGPKVTEPGKQPAKKPAVISPSPRPREPRRSAIIPLPSRPSPFIPSPSPRWEEAFGPPIIPSPGPVIAHPSSSPWDYGHPPIAVLPSWAQTQQQPIIIPQPDGGSIVIPPGREPSRQQPQPPWEHGGQQPIIIQPPWEQGKQGPVMIPPPWEQGGQQPIMVQPPWEQNGQQPIMIQPPWEQGGQQPIVIEQPDGHPIIISPPSEQAWPQPRAYMSSPWDQHAVFIPPDIPSPGTMVVMEGKRERRAGKKGEDEPKKPSWFSRRK